MYMIGEPVKLGEIVKLPQDTVEAENEKYTL